MLRHSPTVRMTLLAVLAGSLLAGCTVNPVTGKRELIAISQDQEIAMGVQATPQFEKEFGGKVANPELQAYVQTVGQAVAGKSDRKMPYEFILVNSEVPNAFALPGGKIFLTAGLMSRMTGERQLAAVLGHETGHVCALHNVKGMQRQMGVELLAEVAGALFTEQGDTAKQVTKVVGSVATLKYSRSDEYQADQLGIRYMARAGYNPWGMVELLTVLKGLSDSEPGSLAEMFQTHPLTSKRIDEAKQMVQSPEYAKYSAKDPDGQADRFLKMRELLIRTMPKKK